jgi:hypothetical protein
MNELGAVDRNLIRKIMLGLIVAGLNFGCSSHSVYIQPVRQYPAQVSTAGKSEGYSKSSGGSERTNPWIAHVGNVRTGEIVKAYGVNRYVDPANPNIMHERHAIYRVEEGPGWVMQTPQGERGIILGPVVGLRNPEDAPAPRDSEIKRELLAAREALEKNNDELVQVRQNQESMGQYMKQSAEAESKLAVIADNLNRRLKKVEERTGTDKEEPRMSTERDQQTMPRTP